jgi:hypothetical protein
LEEGFIGTGRRVQLYENKGSIGNLRDWVRGTKETLQERSQNELREDSRESFQDSSGDAPKNGCIWKDKGDNDVSFGRKTPSRTKKTVMKHRILSFSLNQTPILHSNWKMDWAKKSYSSLEVSIGLQLHLLKFNILRKMNI